MLQNVKKIDAIKFLSTYFGAMVLWWLFLFFTNSTDNLSNYLFAFFFGLIPIFGGIFGIRNFNKWGGLRSFVGKGLLFVSLGLITWGVGQVIFSYYNLFLDVEVPYPSLADVSFILSWPLWGIGIFNLSRATGVKFALRNAKGRTLLIIIPAIAIIASYYLLVTIARGGVIELDTSNALKLFFDLFYPIGSVVLLTMSALVYSLSFSYLGGRFKIPIYLILVGFIVNYMADFSFSYTTTVETFFSGNWVDLLFATAMFIISLGLTFLSPDKIKSPDNLEINDNRI